ncbi:MAG: methyltransferase domain-containing protein [Planctomycetota bacterium]
MQRVRTDEWMDDPEIPPQEHQAALAGLRRLNAISGVSRLLYRHVRRHARVVAPRPLRVMDVACGSGDLAIDWLKRARTDKIRLNMTLVDRSEEAIQLAQRRAAEADVEIKTEIADCITASLPRFQDVAVCSLFMHHLEDHDAIHLVQSLYRSAERSVIICDLERSRLNLALVWAAGHLVTRSPVVHHDGPASVRGAYSREELARLLHRALGYQPPVRRVIPCRMIAVLDRVCEVIEEPALAESLAAAPA